MEESKFIRKVHLISFLSILVKRFSKMIVGAKLGGV
jgi:hypothetical protein